jgi:Tol biopolymer transport system component
MVKNAAMVFIVIVLASCGRNPQEVQPWPDGAQYWVGSASPDTALAWSPFGHVLLFSSSGYIWGYSGTGLPSRRTYTPMDESIGTNGSWSAETLKILYSARADSTDAGEIRTIPGNGTAVKVLYSVDHPVAFPTWNPAGDSLIFSMKHPDIQEWRLYAMAYTPDSLTPEDTPVELPLPSGHCVRPTYSPDGLWILYQYRETSDSPWSIWIASPDGSQARPVAQEGNCVHPCWSPYQGWFAFSTDRWGNHEIAAGHTDHEQVVRITDDPGTDLYPAWNPGFNWIAFSSNRVAMGSNFDIFSIPEPDLRQ